MIESKTVLDQIEIRHDETLRLRFAVQLVENGIVLDQKWHRSELPPGVDPDAQISAVNEHLVHMGRQHVSDEATSKIKKYAKIAHTPEAIAKFERDRTTNLQRELDGASVRNEGKPPVRP